MENILAFGFFMAKIGISSTIKQSSQEKFSPQFEFSIYILSKCKNVKVVKLLLLHFNFLFWDEERIFLLKEKLVEDRFSHYSHRIFFISLAWSHKCAVLLWSEVCTTKYQIALFWPKIPICTKAISWNLCKNSLSRFQLCH